MDAIARLAAINISTHPLGVMLTAIVMITSIILPSLQPLGIMIIVIVITANFSFATTCLLDIKCGTLPVACEQRLC